MQNHEFTYFDGNAQGRKLLNVYNCKRLLNRPHHLSMNAIAERSRATKTQKWAEQMATGGRAWRRCQGRGHLSEGVLAVSSARDSWPRKIVAVRIAEKGNSLLVVDADERLAVVTVDEEGHEVAYEHVSCLGDVVIDACPFMGSDTKAVIITAFGKAILIDWQKNCIIKTFSTADDEVSDEIESARRGDNIRFRKCNGGDQHLVLLDRHGKLWSCGSGPAVGRVKHTSDAEELSCLRPVDFFLGRRVMAVAAGRDFCVALVDTTWQAQATASPINSLSPTRNSCPLGLPLKADAASSSSDETVEYRRKQKRPSCGDSDSGNVSHDSNNAAAIPDSTEQVEHLTQSGLFINRRDAMKYLSDQLQWIGLQSPEAKDDRPQAAEAPTEEDVSPASSFSVSGILKATGAAAADGVKRVSQTVARLSTSLSVTSEWAEGEEVCELPLISAPKDPGAVVEEASRHALMHRRSQSTSILERTASAPSAVAHVPAGADSASAWASAPYVHTEVFFWGRGNRGQAGEKDMLDRLQPCQVTALADLRIQKIVCGQSHTLALSLSGCVYGWGDNSCYQSSPECQFKVCSTPSRVRLPEGETAADIAAASTSSYVLTDSGNVYCIGRDSQVSLLDLDAVHEGAVPARIACVNDCCVLSEHWTDSTVGRYKALEKQLLQSLEAAQVKMGAATRTYLATHSDEARTALRGALYLLVEICSSMVQADWPAFLLSHCAELALIKDSSRFERAARDFNQAVLDCLVGDCLPNVDSESSIPAKSPCGSEGESHKATTLQYFVSDWVGALDLLIDCLMAMSIEGRKCKTLAVLRACDAVEKCASVLKNLQRSMEKARQAADETCKFWDTAGPRILPLKTPRRRVVLDSKVVPITMAHASSFTKTWIILMNDSLVVNSGYSGIVQYSLHVVWVESFGQDESKVDPQNRHEISLITPEDTLVLVAPNAVNKTEWLNALQKSILDCLFHHLGESDGSRVRSASPRSRSPPIARKTTYTFCKSSDLRGATYDGCWLQGKMHGSGTLTWPDGRVYRGLWRHNEQHGNGRLETPVAVYEGQWTRGKFEGHGRILHTSGDTYEGMLKDGKPHGQGVFKQGRFLGSGASVYNGEWVNGLRHGYGVADDIVAGEKYMGMFAHDVKSGPGCVVTLDGVYYEGLFSHGKMCGKGVMLFEDETCYEGNFADAGVFSGQGTLTYANGDRLEGVFYGNYTDGMKFNGTVYRNTKPVQPSVVFASQNTPLNKERLGQFCVSADRKWTALFSHYYDVLSIGDTGSKQAANTGLVWEHMAILINQSKNIARVKLGPGGYDALDGLLETIPEWQCSELNHSYLRDVDEYLSKAFVSPLHPLHDLLISLTHCFNATYGSVRVHPRLLKHAVEEFESIVRRLYEVVRALFPALPDSKTQKWIAAASDEFGHDERSGKMVSASSVVHQHIVPQISASLFMLYALYYKKDDDEYWSRILKWNKNPDIALLSFLGVKQCFWQFEQQMSSALSDRSRNSSGGGSISQIRDRHFVHAIETLQHIKTKFTPLEKLSVILDTFREINRVGQEMSGASFCWSMDELFPVFQYIVIRARILQLGAEIHLIQDLVEPYLLTGEYGFMLITLQAAYYQILKESLSI